MSEFSKITERHRQRRAVVYVRQSTPGQVGHQSMDARHMNPPPSAFDRWPSAACTRWCSVRSLLRGIGTARS